MSRTKILLSLIKLANNLIIFYKNINSYGNLKTASNFIVKNIVSVNNVFKIEDYNFALYVY